jgi:hypothetical protein
MLKPAAIITRGFLSLAQPMVERQHGNAKGKIAGNGGRKAGGAGEAASYPSVDKRSRAAHG